MLGDGASGTTCAKSCVRSTCVLQSRIPKSPCRDCQGKQLGLPLAVVEQQRQMNCGRPELLPPPCPALPYVCRQLCSASIHPCVKWRAGCLPCRFPACPSELRVGIPCSTAHPAPSPPGPSTAFWPPNPSPCGSHMCSRVSVPENKRQHWLRFNPIERQGCRQGTFLKALPGCPEEH